MRISINGAETEESSFQGETLKEVLDEIVKSHSGTYIRRVWLDGQEVSSSAPDTLMSAVSSVELLELELADLKDLMANNLSNAKEYLEKLIPGFQKAADLFRMGNEQEAHKFYLQILDGIDWISQVVQTVVNSRNKELEGQDLKDRQERLTGLMTQMLEANQNQDWVLLADLLEYEMIPFYENWQEALSKMEA
ncbi:MAG: hypothetical protein HN472_00670 [Nitrospina sp.]|jgi:hypothetical protein|nr:hypothetical protein [Nitrospina sp.]MBT3508039.1 hypothetical protein [Nitrospina sp.]MBT3876566.1 hypothetical protein [Nitrospina sp.]MBT4049585.1 hypothetical protein [Nitrospina sp.]MBT4558297.1 hypothetical protein [Nitrospina sp.]